MRLVTEIVEELDAGLICRVAIGQDFVFLRAGEADAVVCVELVAQTVACFVGLAEHREGIAPRGGLLVGCRDARFHVEKLRAGDDLLVRVQRQWIREPAASFTGSVTRGAELVADVELSVVSGVSVDSLANVTSATARDESGTRGGDGS